MLGPRRRILVLYILMPQSLLSNLGQPSFVEWDLVTILTVDNGHTPASLTAAARSMTAWIEVDIPFLTGSINSAIAEGSVSGI